MDTLSLNAQADQQQILDKVKRREKQVLSLKAEKEKMNNKLKESIGKNKTFKEKCKKYKEKLAESE